MQPLLSVIIPVYNVEKYIKQCFESLFLQIKDADVEIICIDDGSTDNSGLICDEYFKNHNQLTVVHQQNKGIGAVRNVGLNLAKGRYIAWIDPDDYVDSNWYNEISKTIYATGADVIFFDYVILKGNRKVTKCCGNQSGFIKNEVFLREVVKDVKIQSHLWQKVFKRELFQQVQFPENIRCMEDYAILHKLILKSRKIYYLSKILYFYRVRNNSLVTKVDFEKSYQCFLIARERYIFLDEQGIKVSKIGFLLQGLGVCINYFKINDKSRFQDQYRETLQILRHNAGYFFSEDVGMREKLKFLVSIAGVGNVFLKMYKFLTRVKKGQ